MGNAKQKGTEENKCKTKDKGKKKYNNWYQEPKST